MVRPVDWSKRGPRRLLAAVLVVGVFGGPSMAAEGGQPANPDRGALLYENHCRECHTSQVHIREHRLGRDENGVRRWIWRWQANLRLSWTVEEVDDVYAYLNRHFYHFGDGG